MTKVYYIYHSCFLVEFDDRYLLFDYFDKEVVADTVRFSGGLPQLDLTNKKLYVFASHSHKDHFSLEVLRWHDSSDNISYILSKDIRLGYNYLKRNQVDTDIKKYIKFVKPQEKYQIEDMKVVTLRSNDAGVAYYIAACGQSIYHAGDLNWWNTEGRGELYGEQYGREYRRQLHTIANKHIDLAFVVMDPRLGEDGYYLGMEQFITTVDAECIFPMHMWGDYSWIDRFKHRPETIRLADRIIDIDQEGMIFEIE